MVILRKFPKLFTNLNLYIFFLVVSYDFVDSQSMVYNDEIFLYLQMKLNQKNFLIISQIKMGLYIYFFFEYNS